MPAVWPTLRAQRRVGDESVLFERSIALRAIPEARKAECPHSVLFLLHDQDSMLQFPCV